MKPQQKRRTEHRLYAKVAVEITTQN